MLGPGRVSPRALATVAAVADTMATAATRTTIHGFRLTAVSYITHDPSPFRLDRNDQPLDAFPAREQGRRGAQLLHDVTDDVVDDESPHAAPEVDHHETTLEAPQDDAAGAARVAVLHPHHWLGLSEAQVHEIGGDAHPIAARHRR